MFLNYQYKITAFFRLRGEQVELDLTAAEIKEGVAYLHLREEEDVTYCVKANDIGITLKNKNGMILERDIFLLGNSKKKRKSKKIQNKKTNQQKKEEPTTLVSPNTEKKPGETKRKPTHISTSTNHVPFYERLKKKSFTIKLYPHEYEALAAAAKSSGFKREDYIFACFLRANKRNVTAECKRLEKEHEELLKSLESPEETSDDTVVKNKN